jgi:CRP-like cAMP-binding protein
LIDNKEIKFENYLREKVKVAESDIEELKLHYTIDNYKKGEILMCKEDNNHKIYYVEKGLLRLYSIDEDGKEHILQFAPEGWWLSERNNLSDEFPSNFFIDTIEDSSIVVLDSEFINRASLISMEFRNYHENILQRHINSLYHRINMLISAPARNRYLAFVTLYPNISQRVAQWMIASYLGITPEGLSRVRKQLKK